jgi:phosphatidylserine/phosphatidylglycerophosphate/cardiolipin synthase-like enzyme
LKVIGTTKISYVIEEMLDKAEKYLILVSPYIKLNQRLKVRLSDAFERTDLVYLFYRENELKNDELNWFKSFRNLKMFSIKNLHSKIYVHQGSVLVTSMNLYEYSQINNHEIGVLIDYYDDYDEYIETLNEIRIMFESQYDENGLSEIIELNTDYSMGRLFWELREEYDFRNGSKDLYVFVCDKARDLVSFKDNELYQDKTAILRATELGKKRFTILKKRLLEFTK